MKPVSVSKTSNSKSLQDHLKGLSRQAVYVGIPTTTARDRTNQLLSMAGKIQAKKSTRRDKLLTEAAGNQLNNAELLFIFSKGSPATGQPPRSVIEAAIVAPNNREAISYELAEAAKAQLKGNAAEASRRLKRAGIAGANAAKSWFTDPRNGWAPNSQITIDHKGSDRPGIDTGAMRQAITSVTKVENE
jgi:hypothetical protein